MFMPVKALTLNRILDVLLIPLIAFIVALKLQEYFNINLVLITAAVVYLIRELLSQPNAFQIQRLNALDYAVLLVVLMEFVTFSTSTYRANGFLFLMEVCFLLLFYALVRFNLKYEYQRVALFIFISLCAAYLAGLGIFSLFRLRRNLRALELPQLIDFRNLIWFLNPVGMSIGEWVTVLFVMLPFPVILFIRYRRSRLARVVTMIVFAGIVFMIVGTFNRGAYVALFAAFAIGSILFYAYRLFPLKKILLFDTVVVALVIITLMPLARPFIATLSVVKTTSQTRSLEARRSIWTNSFDIVKEHPLLGIGTNNFAMRYVAFDESADGTFVLRPFNYFLHLLIEKGVLGLLVYLLLLFSFFIVSHRKVRLLQGDVYRASVVVCFMIAYAAVMVRDLSESSILANRGASVILWFMFANNARLKE
jgi:O-antigen ligase